MLEAKSKMLASHERVARGRVRPRDRRAGAAWADPRDALDAKLSALTS